MKNALNLILPALLLFPCTAGAQQGEFPEGTFPNEHNISGADYPRIGTDRRVHFKVYAPDAKR